MRSARVVRPERSAAATTNTAIDPAPAPSVLTAATPGDTSVSIESHLTRLSRVAKTSVAMSARINPTPAQVLRSVPLADQQKPAGDHEHGADDERSFELFAEEDERDREREQRPRSHDHRGTRGAGFTYCEGEQELRQTGAE